MELREVPGLFLCPVSGCPWLFVGTPREGMAALDIHAHVAHGAELAARSGGEQRIIRPCG